MWLQDYSNPKSLGSRLRRRRLEVFLDLVRTACRDRGECRILDVGGRVSYWRTLEPELQDLPGVSLTLINIESPDDTDETLEVPHVSLVGDACAMTFEDRAFDVVHSNSVIEHVGSWPRMEAFASESRRVGRALFVQTPSYWFPVEPHFRVPGFAFLPRPLQIRLLMSRANGFYARAESVSAAMKALEECQLLDRAQMRFLFPDAQIRTERFAGLEKSLIAIRTA